jgi:hypothetical protein
MTTVLMCPRRAEVPNANAYSESDQWDTDDTCSFCGSLNPELVLEWMRTGQCSLGPTDKSYKVYIEKTDGTKHTKGADKFYFQHFDEEQMQEFIRIFNLRPRPFEIGYPGKFYVLPFFVTYGSREEGETNDATSG